MEFDFKLCLTLNQKNLSRAGPVPDWVWWLPINVAQEKMVQVPTEIAERSEETLLIVKCLNNGSCRILPLPLLEDGASVQCMKDKFDRNTVKKIESFKTFLKDHKLK